MTFQLELRATVSSKQTAGRVTKSQCLTKVRTVRQSVGCDIENQINIAFDQ
jgi:hypothetical protein